MKTYQGSHQKYGVVCDKDVMVPVRDGVSLATDIYFPAVNGDRADGKFPVILVRTPYNKLESGAVTDGKYYARRGYVCAIQDVRGRFKSEGEWYAFAKEAPDGYDAVEWITRQPWSNDKIGTMGSSYGGSSQSALATLDPPGLATMIVAVGASNYYHCSMRQNGALEQRFHVYVLSMACSSKEALADPDLRSALKQEFDDIQQIVSRYPLREGATILSRLPSYERWAMDILTHGEYDDYWKQRGYAISEYYEEHADVPTMYLGGWYDSYARATCENFVELSKIKNSDQRLVMGPWTHGGWNVTHSGDVDFGTESHIDLNDFRLKWFDRYLKDMDTEVSDWSPATFFTMEPSANSQKDRNGRLIHGGKWRSESEWPPVNTILTSYYLHKDGLLSLDRPSGSDSQQISFAFDPKDPVPTIGGGISAANSIMAAGAYDQRGRSDFYGCKDTLPLNSRHDVLSYQTEVLTEDVEVTGPIEMHLWAASSAVDTDFTAKLLDSYPSDGDYAGGLAINITDSIIRARYRNGWDKPEMMTPNCPYEFVFKLYPTSYVFKAGHRIRLDISSSNWPRFDVNPNTGGPLGIERLHQIATQTVFHDEVKASHIVLPLQRA